MRKFVLNTLLLLSFAAQANCSEPPKIETMNNKEVMQYIAGEQNSMPRNESGLVPIDDTLSLLSSTVEGNPAYILSTYIVETVTFKMYLVPYITSTDRENFHIQLEEVFKDYLSSYVDFVEEQDFLNFCNNETVDFMNKRNIRIKKEFLDEEKNHLFTVVIEPSFCARYLAGLDKEIKTN